MSVKLKLLMELIWTKHRDEDVCDCTVTTHAEMISSSPFSKFLIKYGGCLRAGIPLLLCCWIFYFFYFFY